MEVSKLVQSLRFCGDKESVCTACGRYDDMGVDGGTNACMCDLMQKAADTIEALQAELRDEMHRHDRLQDFEVAEAQQLAELRAAHRWIPVTERLPEKDVRVLVRLADDSRLYTKIDTDRIHYDNWVRWGTYVTHWMPLPEPPKEG